MTYLLKDYPSREAQWVAAMPRKRVKHSTWCMAHPSVGVAVGACDKGCS